MALQLGIRPKKILDLWELRLHIAQHLILHKDSQKRGELSESDVPQRPNEKTKTEERPYSEETYDNYGHFLEIDEKKDSTRCKLENCKGKSKTYWVKCNVQLCRNCFDNFHTQ